MMNRKGKYLLVILFTVILLMIIKEAPTDAYVGSIFSYTYEGQTLTYQVLKEPTVTENGTAKVIFSMEVNDTLGGKVIIPATVTNQRMEYQVIGIGRDAFAEAKGVTSITLPDTVETIGSSAFYNCSNLTEINIPSGVTRIENETFRGCSSLININLADSVSLIGNRAFEGCSKLVSINLSNKLYYIGTNAFYGCSSIERLVIPRNVNYIGASAFEGCSNLKSINIPDGITSIEDNLFKDCINLTSVSIPESIKSIGQKAFYNCSSLENIYLPNGVTKIEAYAFYLCTSLTSIKIPYGVTSIKDNTFMGCSNLTEIKLSDRITSIGNYAFFGCKNLYNIDLPEGLTSIGSWAFYDCEYLRPIKIPRSVTYIGQGEFPYAGVFVYKNSYAETYFKENQPEYYQIIKIPLEEMSFSVNVMNLSINETVKLQPNFYPSYSTDIIETINWSSSNEAVASVNSNGEVKGLQAGEVDITAVMGKFSVTCHVLVGGEVVNPTAIAFTSSDLTINKGESVRLPIKFTPANTTNQKITWSSSNTSVVTVENGRIIAKSQGTATIKAESGSLIAECSITVRNPLKEVYSDYSSITLTKGESQKVAISYYPMDTTEDTTTIWKSSDEAVATVVNGVIKAVKPGTAEITATTGSFTNRIPVTVHIPLESLTLTEKEITLTVGESQTLPLIIVPSDTTDEIAISSSDESVAIYSAGTITALKRGKTTITVESGTYKLSTLVTVETDIESIALNKSSLSLYLGKSETLSVAFNPANSKDDKTVTWSSSNKSVATVDSRGVIKTTGIGTATITATAGGDKTVICKVTVKLAVPTSFKAVSGGHDTVKLSWGGVSGTSGYEIYRSSSKTGKFTMLKTTTSKSLSNTGLTSGTAYYYKVRAYRYQGSKKVYSSFTTIVGATPISATPTNVKIVKPKSGTVNFTWGKVTGAYGYEVYRTSSKTEPYKLIKNTTSLHFINYGLTKGKTYSYKVRAYKIVGKKKVYSNFSSVYSIKM